MDILYSITQVKEQDGIYEIHPCNNDIVSGIIKSENGTLTDKEKAINYHLAWFANHFVEVFRMGNKIYNEHIIYMSKVFG